MNHRLPKLKIRGVWENHRSSKKCVNTFYPLTISFEITGSFLYIHKLSHTPPILSLGPCEWTRNLPFFRRVPKMSMLYYSLGQRDNPFKQHIMPYFHEHNEFTFYNTSRNIPWFCCGNRFVAQSIWRYDWVYRKRGRLNLLDTCSSSVLLIFKISTTIAVHVHQNSWCISLRSFAKQQREPQRLVNIFIYNLLLCPRFSFEIVVTVINKLGDF